LGDHADSVRAADADRIRQFRRKVEAGGRVEVAQDIDGEVGVVGAAADELIGEGLVGVIVGRAEGADQRARRLRWRRSPCTMSPMRHASSMTPRKNCATGNGGTSIAGSTTARQ